jgi:soluble lytic murein transglycosylase-like protein
MKTVKQPESSRLHIRSHAIGLCTGYALILLAVPHASYADVIEISPTGAVTTYAGPTVFVGTTASPIAKPTVSAAPANAGPLYDPAYPMSMHPVLLGYLNEAAAKYGVDPALVRAVAWQESRFRADAVSPKGAIGIMQLMPSTAQALGVNAHDPRQNIMGGVAYLSTLLTQFNGDIRLTLAAYNAGPQAVVRYGGIPPYRETQSYVSSIATRLSLP